MMLRSAGDAVTELLSASSSPSLGPSRSDISCRLASGVGVQMGALSTRVMPKRNVPKPCPPVLVRRPGVHGADGTAIASCFCEPILLKLLLRLSEEGGDDEDDAPPPLFLEDPSFFLPEPRPVFHFIVIDAARGRVENYY